VARSVCLPKTKQPIMIEYKFKPDLAFLIPQCIILLLSFVVLFFDQPVGIAVIVFAMICFLYVYLKTRYLIRERFLIIKSGIMNERSIEIRRIYKIEELRDRLEIYYNNFDNVSISPRNRAEMLAHLTSINPEIACKPRNLSINS
jgi:hypothetical protein